jgi:hypothetical protein
MLSSKVRFGDIVASVGDYLKAGPGVVHDAEALEDSVFFFAHVGGPVIKGLYRSRFLGHAWGDINIAPPWSIVDPDATGRSRCIGQAAIAAARAATGV